MNAVPIPSPGHQWVERLVLKIQKAATNPLRESISFTVLANCRSIVSEPAVQSRLDAGTRPIHKPGAWSLSWMKMSRAARTSSMTRQHRRSEFSPNCRYVSDMRCHTWDDVRGVEHSGAIFAFMRRNAAAITACLIHGPRLFPQPHTRPVARISAYQPRRRPYRGSISEQCPVTDWQRPFDE